MSKIVSVKFHKTEEPGGIAGGGGGARAGACQAGGFGGRGGHGEVRGGGNALCSAGGDMLGLTVVYRGTVKGNVVVLEPGAELPEGTPVQVEAAAPADKGAQGGDLFHMGDLAMETGISDLAVNADHYLYGHPKAHDAANSVFLDTNGWLALLNASDDLHPRADDLARRWQPPDDNSIDRLDHRRNGQWAGPNGAAGAVRRDHSNHSERPTLPCDLHHSQPDAPGFGLIS